MSNRPAVKSAFAGLRPSIVREPSRAVIAPQDEVALFAPTKEPATTPSTPARRRPTKEEPGIAVQASAFPDANLLTKKRKDVLVPVTFRMPQRLKEQLNEVAKKHELSQTDLINEGIELNLQRYR